MDSRRRFSIVYALGLILCALALTETLLTSQNLLLLNGNWISSKRVLEMGLAGADETLVTRAELSGNVLNLGVWYGFQEVILKKSRQPAQISFKFELPDESYVDVIFNKTKSGYSGVRISGRNDLPSRSFVSNNLGTFLGSNYVQFSNVDSGWHLATLEKSAFGLSLKIDGTEITTVIPDTFSDGQIAFRSGRNGAKIDDVRIVDQNGSVFEESFRNTRKFVPIFLIHLLALAILTELLFFIFRRKARPTFPALQLKSLLTHVFFIVVLIWQVFDYTYWSKLPFRAELRALKTGEYLPISFPENLRLKISRHWAKLFGATEDLYQKMGSEGYNALRIWSGPVFCTEQTCRQYLDADLDERIQQNKKCRLIVYWGTSQTIGAGADRLENTFVARIHRDLNNSGDQCYETLNLAISGALTTSLVGFWERGILKRLKPDLMVINISNNDNPSGLERLLPDLLSKMKKAHIKAILLKEANSAEAYENWHWLLENHEFLTRMGKTYNYKVFSLHDYLMRAESMTSGFVWWDRMHLSSHGHSLVAGWLKPIIQNELKQERPWKSPISFNSKMGKKENSL